jgi:hypothetical protein
VDLYGRIGKMTIAGFGEAVETEPLGGYGLRA